MHKCDIFLVKIFEKDDVSLIGCNLALSSDKEGQTVFTWNLMHISLLSLLLLILETNIQKRLGGRIAQTCQFEHFLCQKALLISNDLLLVLVDEAKRFVLFLYVYKSYIGN